MCTKRDLDIILDRLIRVYKEVYGKDVVRIVLYGSYARGDNQHDSDIDVVAIVKGDRSSLQSKLKEIWDASNDWGVEYDTVISPTVIPYDEYQQYKDVMPYYRNIEEEGVDLVA